MTQDQADAVDDVIAIRRRLHAQPELGFLEFKTAEYVAETLHRLGFEVLLGREALDADHVMGLPADADSTWRQAVADAADPHLVERMSGGRTGVVGILRGHQPGRVVAVRADMDALPVTESADAAHVPNAEGFASRRTGAMHACGHDGHVAIVLTLAARFVQRPFAGTLKLIFQPAEEGLRGARAMAAAGVVDDVDDLLCIHLGVGLPSGRASLNVVGSLASTKLRARFTGTSAHAGLAPERGRSALLAAASAALAVHSLTRYSTADTRVNVGTFDAPGATNIVPAHAVLGLEVRASDSVVADGLTERVTAALQGSAAAYGVRCDIETTGSAPVVTCSQDLVQRIQSLPPRPDLPVLCTDWVDTGSDDAAWLIDRTHAHGGAGTYLVIGADLAAGHHEPQFDFDETVLPPGVDLLEYIVRALGVQQ